MPYGQISQAQCRNFNRIVRDVLTFLSPSFLTSGNILNVLRQVSTNANIALGMTLVILTGGIDLSVGSTMALAGTMSAGFIALSGLPVWLAISLGLFVGIMVGLFNGFVITKTGMPPFIVTMAMTSMARGLVYVYTNGLPVRTLDPIYNKVGNGYLGPIPLPVIYTTVLYISVDLAVPDQIGTAYLRRGRQPGSGPVFRD